MLRLPLSLLVLSLLYVSRVASLCVYASGAAIAGASRLSYQFPPMVPVGTPFGTAGSSASMGAVLRFLAFQTPRSSTF